MTDVKPEALRQMFDRLATPIDIASVKTQGSHVSPLRSPMVLRAAAALVIVVVLGGVLAARYNSGTHDTDIRTGGSPPTVSSTESTAPGTTEPDSWNSFAWRLASVPPGSLPPHTSVISGDWTLNKSDPQLPVVTGHGDHALIVFGDPQWGEMNVQLGFRSPPPTADAIGLVTAYRGPSDYLLCSLASGQLSIHIISGGVDRTLVTQPAPSADPTGGDITMVTNNRTATCSSGLSSLRTQLQEDPTGPVGILLSGTANITTLWVVPLHDPNTPPSPVPTTAPG